MPERVRFSPIMSRHFAVTLGIAVLVATTVLLLADAGVFGGSEAWLLAHYQSERLLKDGATVSAAWKAGSVAVAALLVAWVASDELTRRLKLGFGGAALVAMALLSLTLVVYGQLFSPVPAMTAAVLALVMGLLVTETPGARTRRHWHQWTGDRATPATVDALAAAFPGETPGTTLVEAAVVACRVIDPLPPATQAAAHAETVGHLVAEATAFLRRQPSGVLDLPAADGARAFFGLAPGGDPAASLAAAAEAALALARHLQEEASLLAAAGRPAPKFGVGLSSGVLSAGLLGRAEAPCFTAFGPPAEQSRQLASLNARHGTRVLAGRRAAQLGRDRFEFRAIEGDSLHELTGARAAESHDDPLVGSGDLDLHDSPPVRG